MLASSSGPYLVLHPWRANSSRLSEPQKSKLLVRRLASTLWLSSKSPKSPARFRCVTSPALCHPFHHLRLLWHLMSALLPRTRYHLHQSCTQPTHMPSWKALRLTNPKGMNRNPSAIILHSKHNPIRIDMPLKSRNLSKLKKDMCKIINLRNVSSLE